MGKRAYIETSVISYLAARPSRNVVASAWQQVTSTWWEKRKDRFELFISELVVAEASQGDPEAVQRRLDRLQGIANLDITDNVVELAERLIRDGALPREAADDAVHVAVAAVHGMDYLLTWNFRHLDNAEKKPLLRSICALAGHRCPEICTPQELMGEDENA